MLVPIIAGESVLGGALLGGGGLNTLFNFEANGLSNFHHDRPLLCNAESAAISGFIGGFLGGAVSQLADKAANIAQNAENISNVLYGPYQIPDNSLLKFISATGTTVGNAFSNLDYSQLSNPQ